FVHWANIGSSHPVVTWRAHALRDRSKPGSLRFRPPGALHPAPLPPCSTWPPRDPSPGDARAMLAAADAGRPAGHSGQFGRFTGIDYSDRPSVRAIQTAAPLLSGRTGYAIPPGPYRDDARGPLVPAGQNPFGPPPGGAQPQGPSGPPPSGPSQSGPPPSGPAQPGPGSSGRPPSAPPPPCAAEGPGCPTAHHPLLKPALGAYGDPVMPAPSALTPPVRRKPLLAVLLAPLFMALIAVSVIN